MEIFGIPTALLGSQLLVGLINGSFYAIEGIVSEDGRILGKMGHTERYGENLFKNICGEKRQPIFENAVAYFRKRN